jgi:transposase InsO family protein
VRDIEQANRDGARLAMACAIAGLTLRTLQRWKAGQGFLLGDGRPLAERTLPSHALTPAEREAIVLVANEPRFASLPPSRIVPMLADEGRYIASESSFRRVLQSHGQTALRGRARARQAGRPATTHIATGPNQLWCWDMTYLLAVVTGRLFHLYLILEVYSRKVVGWDVQETDSDDHAARLV